MLVIKLCSVVEVSEMVEIKCESLREWQRKFKDAATQGDEVLRTYQDEVDSSSSSPSGIRTFFGRFNSRKDDVEKLSRTVELLEQMSAEVNDFIQTLKLQLLSKKRKQREYCVLDGLRSIKENETGMKALSCELLSVTLWDLLSKKSKDDLLAVEGLAALLQSAVYKAMQKDEDGSCLGQWIAKLRGAIQEGNHVATTIRSYRSFAYDETLDKVSAIVTSVRVRLESMVSDLDDFTILAEVEELAIKLTLAPSHAYIFGCLFGCSRIRE